MATTEQCWEALRQLADSLAEVEPELRARHVPARTVACTVSDLDVIFFGRIDEHGVHDLNCDNPDARSADVRVSVSSDDLVALAAGDDSLVQAWLRGRLQVSAPVRDILRLRSLVGL